MTELSSRIHRIVANGVAASRRLPVLAPMLLFVTLALTIVMKWHHFGTYRPTGDEPHYMIIARGIFRYHGFETTATYRDAFAKLELPFAGQAPSPGNTHSVVGPHGLFSIHNVGLPILLAMPLAALGLAGARATMIVLAAGVAFLAHGFAGLFTPDRRLRIWLAVALSCAAPFLPAAGQIYPDLPAGILFGLVLLHLCRRAIGPGGTAVPPAVAALALALAPWLQIKFTAAALISFVGCICWGGRAGQPLANRFGFFAAPLLLSMWLVAAYNKYAFGNWLGPYGANALSVSWHSVMVLCGLHLDQFQGIFLLHPLLLLAPVGFAALLRRDAGFGVFFLLLYASLVMPNAMHPAWYGGAALAGRFIWTGAVLLFLPAVLALRVLAAANRTVAVLCAVSVAVQVAYYARYTSRWFSLYNQNFVPFVGSYATLFAPFQRYLPAFCNMDWSFRYFPNYGWLCGVFALLAFGWMRGAAARRIALVLAVLLPALSSAAGAIWQPRHAQTLIFRGIDLPGDTGHVAGTTRAATPVRDRSGFLNFGPYVTLPAGRYAFHIAYSSSARPDQTIGHWDIVSNFGTNTLRPAAAMNGTDGRHMTIDGTLDVGTGRDGTRIEIRTFFGGDAPMVMESLTIDTP